MCRIRYVGRDDFYIHRIGILTDCMQVSLEILTQRDLPANQHSLDIGIGFNDFPAEDGFDNVLAFKPFFDRVLHRVAFHQVIPGLNALANDIYVQIIVPVFYGNSSEKRNLFDDGWMYGMRPNGERNLRGGRGVCPTVSRPLPCALPRRDPRREPRQVHAMLGAICAVLTWEDIFVMEPISNN